MIKLQNKSYNLVYEIEYTNANHEYKVTDTFINEIVIGNQQPPNRKNIINFTLIKIQFFFCVNFKLIIFSH